MDEGIHRTGCHLSESITGSQETLPPVLRIFCIAGGFCNFILGLRYYMTLQKMHSAGIPMPNECSYTNALECGGQSCDGQRHRAHHFHLPKPDGDYNRNIVTTRPHPSVPCRGMRAGFLLAQVIVACASNCACRVFTPCPLFYPLTPFSTPLDEKPLVPGTSAIRFAKSYRKIGSDSQPNKKAM